MNLNKLIKEIKSGNNLEEHLSAYGNSLAMSYYRQASYHLAMNLTEYYDAVSEGKGELADECRAMLSEVMTMIKSAVEGDYTQTKTWIDRIDAMRTQVITNIGDLEDYTYYLKIYEYLLNQAEYKTGNKHTEYDIEAFADEVISYVSVSDPVEANERIQAVMGELPVRMTIDKFTDMVRKSCQYYCGVRNDIAEMFFESIKECVRPMNFDGLNPKYESLMALCRSMEQLSVRTIGAKECAKALEDIEGAAVDISDNLKLCLYMADIINNFYILLLTKMYVLAETSDTKKAAAVIKDFCHSVEKGSFLTPDEDIVGLLRELTDCQDTLRGEHLMLENALYEIMTLYPDKIDGLALNGLYNSLYYCARMFNEASLEPLGKRGTYFAVDEAWMDAAVTQLEKYYREVLATLDREFKRAEMAFVLESLPVCFDRLDDFRQYIIRCMEGCHDESARQVCVDLVSQMILEEQDSDQ